MLISNSPPSTFPPLPSVPKSNIITMAMMSSRMSTLNTSEANFCWRSPRSSNALTMMPVDDMANMPPR